MKNLYYLLSLIVFVLQTSKASDEFLSEVTYKQMFAQSDIFVSFFDRGVYKKLSLKNYQWSGPHIPEDYNEYVNARKISSSNKISVICGQGSSYNLVQELNAPAEELAWSAPPSAEQLTDLKQYSIESQVLYDLVRDNARVVPCKFRETLGLSPCQNGEFIDLPHNLMLAEFLAIYHYTSNAYQLMNASLWERNPEERRLCINEVKQELLPLTNGLKKLPQPMDKDKPFKYTFRGARLSLEQVKAFCPERSLSLPAFWSTSSVIGVAVMYAKDSLVVIKHPQVGKDISKLSYFITEKELIYPMLSRFKLKGMGHIKSSDRFQLKYDPKKLDHVVKELERKGVNCELLNHTDERKILIMVLEEER